MSGFVVYSVPGSPYGRSVIATLTEKAAEWQLSAVAPGTVRKAPHIERHPFGKVPVLDHDDFRIYETQAILRYLDRVLPLPPMTPAGARAAAAMDQVMNITDCYLFQGVAADIVFQRIVGPRLMGTTPDESVLAAAMPRARVVFTELARLLGDKPYMAGDMVTLADMQAAPQMALLAETPEWEELSAPHSALTAWLARMAARPSFSATTWERIAKLAGKVGGDMPGP